MNNELFLKEATKYMGVRYVHQGRTLAGVDCGGLILAASGLSANFPAHYSTFPQESRIKAGIESIADRAEFNDLIPGDILLFKIFGNAQHFAIKSTLGIIHAHQPVGKVVEQSLSEKWMMKYHQGYKIRWQ